MTSRSYAMGLTLACLLLAGGALFHTAAGYFDGDLSGHAWGTDDAYISYRYAANLADGKGLTFNEGERVEGYSNLLYVLVMSVVSTFADQQSIYPISTLLNLAFAMVALYFFCRLALGRLREGGAAAAAVLFALTPALWLWVGAGLETTLVLALQIGIWLAVEKAGDGRTPGGGWWLVGLSVLSVLSRADGFLVPCLAALWLAVTGRRRMAAVTAGVVVSAQALLTVWRLVYYGHPLPNTYYVKVSGPMLDRVQAGIEQLWAVALHQRLLPYLLLFAGLLVATAWRWWKYRPPLTSLAQGFDLVLATALVGYWIFVGGDVFNERFLLVLYPIGTLRALQLLGRLARAPYAVCRRLTGRVPGVAIYAGLMLLGTLHLGVLNSDPRYDYTRAEDKYDRWVKLGRFFKTKYPNATLAADAAGKITFCSGLRTIDMLGLNDEHIGHLKVDFFSVGHNKYDADYVLERKPDFIAAWILANGDMIWGLDRQKYEAAGYRIRYLIYAGKKPRLWLFDIRTFGLAQMGSLHGLGYHYGVLQYVGK